MGQLSCINAGSNVYVIGTTDLDGNARVMFGTVDMGAYESQVEVVIATDPPVLTGRPVPVHRLAGHEQPATLLPRNSP